MEKNHNLGLFLSIIVIILVIVLPGVLNAQYYGDCTYHAYRECVGNNIYWYSSCGAGQDLYYVCPSNQVCQYGQCVNYIAPILPALPTYQPYYRTACYKNSVYWFDSLGVVSGLYKSCNDNNTCTQDICSNSKCINTLNCDNPNCCALTQPEQTEQIEQPEPQIQEQPQTQEQIQDNAVATAAVSATETVSKDSSGFGEFIKRWYMWILGGLILLFLFVVVYKRFSSEV